MIKLQFATTNKANITNLDSNLNSANLRRQYFDLELATKVLYFNLKDIAFITGLVSQANIAFVTVNIFEEPKPN